MIKTIIIGVLFCFFSNLTNGQEINKLVEIKIDSIFKEYKPALVFSTKEITIDGDFNDWPKSMEVYPISNIEFDDQPYTKKDISGNFRIAYNKERKSIYLAVEMIDDDIVKKDKENRIDYLDNMYLYIDLVHSKNGSSRSLFQSSLELKDFSGPISKFWSPYSPSLDWQSVNLKTSNNGQTVNFEYEIFLDENFKLNNVIGLDIILIDNDTEGDEQWITWKPGTSKSANSTRLGEVILVEDKSLIGFLEGKIKSEDKRINTIQSVVISSLENPYLWLRANVDSLGIFRSRLPQGTYNIEPEISYTSPLYSSGFKQNSRKIERKSNNYIKIEANSNSKTQLALQVKPLPLDIFEENGILFQGKFQEYKVDEFVKIFKEYYDIPGVSIALIKDNKVIYDKVFGVSNTLTGEALKKETLFEAASITKSVFAIMVLKLVETGKLDLDKPLYEYLRFKNIEHNKDYKIITARIVLNHQTGLDNWPVGAYSGYLSDAKADLEFKPGTDFKYSGEAFNYLGRVVEHITKKSLSQLFQEEIVTTFNLSNTYFSYSDSLESKITLGHYHQFPNFKDKFKGVDSPASSLMTNADDFSKLVLGLLNKKYLSSDSYKLISEPHQIISDKKKLYDIKIKQAIAHGFFVADLPQGKMIMHGGNNGDFDCKYGFMPDNKIGYVVFTNSNLGDEFIRLLELYLFRGKKSLEDINN